MKNNGIKLFFIVIFGLLIVGCGNSEGKKAYADFKEGVSKSEYYSKWFKNIDEMSVKIVSYNANNYIYVAEKDDDTWFTFDKKQNKLHLESFGTNYKDAEARGEKIYEQNFN
ncbi:hypothetical protein [Carnobacterium divergens]|uniref:hypothetical protein n=1 Tax=Carnobacterium divergens TaxID=2748 RepID=UPI0039B101DD